jgi:hypothetical protein
MLAVSQPPPTLEDTLIRRSRKRHRSSRVPLHPLRRLTTSRRRWTGLARDAGMTTAEYAVGTLAAAGFASLLVVILRSGEVQGLLLGIIRHALSMG